MSLMERLDQIDKELDLLPDNDPKVRVLLDELVSMDEVLELQISYI